MSGRSVLAPGFGPSRYDILLWHVYVTEQYAPRKAVIPTSLAVNRRASLHSAPCVGVLFKLPPTRSAFAGDDDTSIETR